MATSHFLKFQAQAAIKTLISSLICPFSRFLDSLKSDFKCPIIGSMAARLLHSLRHNLQHDEGGNYMAEREEPYFL